MKSYTQTDPNGHCLQIAVIGGGASGLFAAIHAAKFAQQNRRNVKVCIYEAEQRVGKKLLATGNGRCNLSNINLSESFYRGDLTLLRSVFNEFSVEDTLSFFHESGLYTRADAAGRIYPAGNQASFVLDFLRSECARLHVQIVTGTPILKAEKKELGFLLNHSIYADRILYCCGSPAGQSKTDRSMRLLRSFQIQVVPFFSSLCPLKIFDFTKSLKGVRALGNIQLYADGRLVTEEWGEIQYTEYGLSGIPVMQLSAAATEGLLQNKKITLSVDSVPDIPKESLKRTFFMLIQRNGEVSLSILLGGFIHKRLADFFIRSVGLHPDQHADSVPKDKLDRLIDLLKEKSFVVEKPMDMTYAQAAAGGVLASEINKSTLELNKVPGFYVCGEALDVVGQCGGYNLQWAWSSAYVAGIHAVKDYYFDQDQ